jgi:hypothetical protein
LAQEERKQMLKSTAACTHFGCQKRFPIGGPYPDCIYHKSPPGRFYFYCYEAERSKSKLILSLFALSQYFMKLPSFGLVVQRKR